MTFLRRVDGPTVADTVMLRTVLRGVISGKLQPNKIRHSATAGKIASCLFAVPDEFCKPLYGPALHSNR